MAVYIAAADESAGAKHPYFYWGGFLGPEAQWQHSFAPAWEANVLNSEPRIRSLHQRELRSPQWQKKHGLSPDDVHTKLDAAWHIVNGSDWLLPIALRVDKTHFHDTLRSVRVQPQPGIVPYRLQPDYICFQLFATAVVDHVAKTYPDCDKVDFVVEGNQAITSHMQEFHGKLKEGFLTAGRPQYARLVGDFIVGGKERIPLQAADLLAWYENRIGSTGLDERDTARYTPLSKRHGAHFLVSQALIEGFLRFMAARSRPT